jgi:hypothetical protein
MVTRKVVGIHQDEVAIGWRPWRAGTVGTGVTSPLERTVPGRSRPKAAEPWYLKTPLGR